MSAPVMGTSPGSGRSGPGLLVSLSPKHNVYHSGYLISAAAAAGATFQIDPSVCPFVPLFHTDDRTVAVDCLDSPSAYDQATLARCDLYLKRSYLPAEAPAAAPTGRIRPFGLNYACRTVRAIAVVLRLRIRSDLRPDNIRAFLASPRPARFELPPRASPDRRIIFNTRLWPRDQVGPTDDAQALNGFRIDLVRHLRQAFGKRFLGGIIPSAKAFEVYPELRESPELIINTPHRRAAYASFSRSPAIGIYTRGLHGSNAFKLGEYLASSKCIIGESLAHHLPKPLGDCHRVRNDIDGILRECDRMLTETDRLREIQQASWRYYQDNIRYDRRIGLMFSGLEGAGAAT